MEVILPESVSAHIWRYGFFEADVCFFILTALEPGMVFVDIGAHFGFFTLLASHLTGSTGQVLAFEPMSYTFTQLAKNTQEHSEYANTRLVNCAAFSSDTQLEFHDFGLVDAGFNSAFGGRNEVLARSRVKNVSVNARSCDSVVKDTNLKRLDVVKIDAESSEIHVLNGMEETIALHSPRIIMEVGDFDLAGVPSSTELVTWLTHRGYCAYEFNNWNLAPHRKRARYGYGNLLFVRE